jgi:hypothetical protein
MHQNLIAILTIVPLLFASGCRQTTNLSGSPLTPVSPLGPNAMLTPAPSGGVGPFGGATRVQPPGTGAVGTPSSYVNPAPVQSSSVHGSFESFAQSAAPSPLQTGQKSLDTGASEVTPARWNETDTRLAGQTAPTTINSGLRQRLSGMPLIDLTNVPPPPGYTVSAPQFAGAIPVSPPGANPNPSVPVPGTYAFEPTRTMTVPYSSPNQLVGAATIQATPYPTNYRTVPGQGVQPQYHGVQPTLESISPNSATLQPAPASTTANNELMWRRPRGAGGF